MAHFDKFANLSPSGWTKSTTTQALNLGNNAHIGLWGGGPGGVDLEVRVQDPTICVVHEEPRPAAYANWRHFLITALRDGETRINANLPGTTSSWASMMVKISGKAAVRLVFFPGERIAGGATVGTIYVIGGAGETMTAAGGPPVGRADRGGHTVDPTPPGDYILGPRHHVTTQSWPMSVIPWDAAIRLNKGEAEFEASAGHWVVATGPAGAVTQAQIGFIRRSNLKPDPDRVTKQVRNIFIDPATGALRMTVWEKNDFGRWGWNLTQNGQNTAYYIHTTPEDEEADAAKRAVLLANSHGCVHLVPSERERLERAGYLKKGVHFEVRPYTEIGPP